MILHQSSMPTRQFRDDICRSLADLLRVALILTRSQDLAEDLVEDTVLKALRGVNSFQQGTNLTAWLLTIMRRTHIDHLRAERRAPLHVELDENLADSCDEHWPQALDESWSHPDRMLEAFEDEQIVRALRQLPPDIQWTLLLVDVQDLDHEMAAQIMDVPIGTVKSRAFRGRKALREKLAPRASACETARTASYSQPQQFESQSPCSA